MGGCFQPGVNKVVIYIGLIQQIYAQGQQINLGKLSPHEDPYEVIYQKISKKGLYRKLSDHLMSHRNNVNQCMMNIFTQVRQRKDRNSYYIHLTLIDEMAKHFESFVDEGPLQKKRQQTREDEAVKEQYINKEIQSRFETLYFQMATEIYDEQPQIRDHLFKSIIKFAEKERDFTNSRMVWQIIDRILNSIQNNELVENATKLYSLLIGKSVDNLMSHERSQQALRIFLQLRLLSTNPSLSADCQAIFSIFIRNCLTSRDYNFIYTVIFQIEDKYMFEEKYMESLEQKLFEIINLEDFRDQFCKGIFKYLISYLCVCGDERLKNRWENALFDIPYQTLKNRHPNILKRQVKINALKTVLRWIRANVVNTNDFITFNRTSLMYCLIFNVCQYIQDRFILQMNVETFFEIYRGCDLICKSIICSQLFQQIHLADDTIIDQTSIFVRINKKILEDLSVNRLDESNYSLFIPIENQLPIKTKIELVQLGCILLDCFPVPFDIVLVENICGFVSSFEDFLQDGTIKQKYQIVCSMISFFKKLREKGEHELIISFIKRYIQSRKQFVSYDRLYFSGYLILQLGQLLFKKIMVPTDVRKLNLKIYCTDSSNIENDIKVYIEKSGSVFEYPVLSHFQISQSKILKKIQFISKQFNKWERQKASKEQESQLNFMMTGFGPLQRKKSWISNSNLSFKTDQSFNDIFQMINDQKYLN